MFVLLVQFVLPKGGDTCSRIFYNNLYKSTGSSFLLSCASFFVQVLYTK